MNTNIAMFTGFSFTVRFDRDGEQNDPWPYRVTLDPHEKHPALKFKVDEYDSFKGAYEGFCHLVKSVVNVEIEYSINGVVDMPGIQQAIEELRAQEHAESCVEA